jgi:uncharacterized protein YllA (UPF0747 family)
MSILKVIRKSGFHFMENRKDQDYTSNSIYEHVNNHPNQFHDDCDIKMMLCVKISKRPFVAGK